MDLTPLIIGLFAALIFYLIGWLAFDVIRSHSNK
jgi:hypothetical protein